MGAHCAPYGRKILCRSFIVSVLPSPPCPSQFTDSVLLHIRFTLRRRDITVSRNSLARCNGRHLRIRHLVQFILAGAVYHNALTNCATRVCCACAGPPVCVAERYLTLRTGCSRGRTPKVVRPQQRKNPLPFPHFEAVTCRQSAPDSPRERGDSQEGGNRRCLPSCAPAG